MSRADLVIAIADHEHCVRAMDASAQVLEQIESCLVRPMHVLEYDQRFFSFQFVERRSEDQVAGRSGIEGRQQRTLRLPPYVVQRAERPRREKRVTCTPQYPRLALLTRKF